MMNKIVYLLAAGALTITACNSKKTEDPTPVTPGTDTIGNSRSEVTSINDMDRAFVLHASMANIAEGEAGTIAQRRGNDASVKEYGLMMEDQHKAVQMELKSLASGLSVSVPDTIDAAHKELSKKLTGLSGKAFDEEYIKAQVKDHKDAIALFENEINTGSHTRIKSFAATHLPHLRMHLQKADSIAMKLNIPLQ